MIEIIKAKFNAGEVKTFLIQGEYLEILEAAYPVDVAMMDRSGAQLSTMRSAEASYFSRPGKYEVIQVTSPNAQTVRLFVGSGDAGTRKTSGDVSVIDGGKARTLANQAFLTSIYNAPGVGNLPYCQLWNPAASGKNLVIKAYGFTVDVASLITLRQCSTASATMQGNPPSKRVGGAVSAMEGRSDIAAPTMSGFYPAPAMGAGGVYEKVLQEPIVVPPGFGLVCSASTPAAILTFNLEYTEDVI